jgi:two-component system LytT family response regulator
MKNHSCFIIDDEPDVRRRLEFILEKIGNVDIIGSAGEPEEAVILVCSLQPEIIFIDVELPRINGFEVIEQIRKFGCNPCFIFVTAFNQYAINAIKNEAFDYILKPVEIDEMKKTLERYYKTINPLTPELPNNAKFDVLSKREKEILTLLLTGNSSINISDKLFISKNTVNTHRRNILAKLNVRNTVELFCIK